MAKESKSTKAVKVPTPPSSSVPSESSDSSRESSVEEPEKESQDEEEEVKVVVSKKGKEKAIENSRPIDTRKYRAPKGMLAVRGGQKSGIDWDDLEKNPELELWAIRVPVGVKVDHLEGVTIELGPNKSKNEALGNFKTKKDSFEIFMADKAPSNPSSKKRPRAEEENNDQSITRGGEEMHSLVALIPNHRQQNKLFQTRPIAQHLVIQRSLPSTVLSHLPSSTSSLITSVKPSPVPGAVLSAEELLNPEAVQAKKISRPQPRLLQMGLKLGGMGSVGGKGLYSNKLEPKVLLPKVLVKNENGMEVDENETPGKKIKKEKKDKSEKGDSERKKEKKEKKEKLKKESSS